MRTTRTATRALGVALALIGVALGGTVDKAKDAVDPDCAVGKALKGAAMKSTVGFGSRCDVAETVRDTLGVADKKKHDKGGGRHKKQDTDRSACRRPDRAEASRPIGQCDTALESTGPLPRLFLEERPGEPEGVADACSIGRECFR